MTCSPARLAANRQNALLSTGPKTPEGKARSRANGLKHGLCASVVVAEDLELIQQRTSDWFFALKPQDEYHVWLVDQVAVVSLRIDRAERMERRLRDRRSLKAELDWEEDIRLEVERLGGKIATKPAEVVEELRRSPVGCDWLMSRWAMLARAADANDGQWTPDQVALAFHLLGTPREFREGHRPGDLLDVEGRVIESGEDRAAFARREIARLIERRDVASELDEVDKALTEVDLFDGANPELKKLRRYEATLHNRLRWCLAELRRVPDYFKPHPDVVHHWKAVFQQPDASGARATEPTPAPMPAPALMPAPAPTPEPETRADRLKRLRMIHPHPPFDIEPDEIPKDGSKPDILAILVSRQEKREKKSELRRDAKRRKLEKLRA